VHGGERSDRTTRAIAEPITLSVTFERDPDGTYSRGYFYSSKGNPNRNALESAFAALEGSKVAVALASTTVGVASLPGGAIDIELGAIAVRLTIGGWRQGSPNYFQSARAAGI